MFCPQNIQESSDSSENSLVQMFSNRACHLLREVAEFMRDKLPLNPSAYPQSLVTEWQEFFSESSFGILNAHFVKKIGKSVSLVTGIVHPHMNVSWSCVYSMISNIRTLPVAFR